MKKAKIPKPLKVTDIVPGFCEWTPPSLPPGLPTAISPKYAALLRDCGDRFRQFVSNEDHVWECTEGAMMGKVVVVQRRKDGKGRIAFFSPKAKWKTVKVKLGEKW